MSMKSGASKGCDPHLFGLGIYGSGLLGLLFNHLLSSNRLKKRVANFVDESNTRVAERRACHGTD